MKQLWKRNAVVGAVLLLVCGAIFLNGRYAGEVEETGKVLGQATEVSAPAPEQSAEAPAEDPAETTAEKPAVESSDYFATARLTRQQARDNALSLLRQAGEEGDPAVAEEVSKGIEALASYTMSEAQIENMVTAKGYDDCVAFLSDDSVSVVVSTATDGLQTEDIARITDVVKQETGLPASAIKILEVS